MKPMKITKQFILSPVYIFILVLPLNFLSTKYTMRNRTEKKVRSRRGAKTSHTYTRKHYSSNDGMLTTVWGPSTWHLLHAISFNYSNHPTCEEKRHYRDFILSLQNVLPCGKCRQNLIKNFEKLPLKWKTMENRRSFSEYVYHLHEIVNKMLGKKSGLSYADVRERYEHFRARCTLPAVTTPKTVQDKTEKGCTEPIYGEKSKCVLKILPQSTKCETFQIDEKCITTLKV